MCKSTPGHRIAFAFLLALAAVAQAQYSGGSGTPENPYQIRTNSDWLALMNTPADWSKHFTLVADLDLKDVALSPVGSYSRHFTGTFDGNGHVIRNAVINQPNSDYVGLFGYLGQGGEISNLRIDVKVTGHSYVGGLVGKNSNGSLLACCAAGLVEVGGYYPQYIGGLVGHSEQGVLTACSASSSVSGGIYAGGLVGSNSGGGLTACWATGSVTASDYTGGLVGSNSQAPINDCNAAGAVSGHSYIGGLVGSNANGNLLACSATGPVEVTGYYPLYAGGLVGHNDQGILTTCSASGSVTGGNYAGGLVGSNSGGDLTACSATGFVTGSDYVGGIAGSNSQATINDCSAAGSIIGHSYLGGLAGKNADGNLFACCATGPVEATGYYPQYAGGLVGQNDQGILTACSASGSVGGGNYTGGLVGGNSGGGLTACSAIGSVGGADYVGGLVGSNSQAAITDCYERGSITGHSYIGGLVGDNAKAMLSACYSVGHVEQIGYYPSYAGGLVGYDPNGQNSMLKNCFWDIETSGQTMSTLGTGRKTDEMKRRAIYIAGGWDFLDESENGIAETWTIRDVNYPELCWQVYYRIAYAPNPPDDANGLDPNVTLSWIPSIIAERHDVYIDDTLVGSPTEPNLTVTGLIPGTTYSWRVDEVNDADPASPWTGNVWRFTVPLKTAHNPIPADDANQVDPNVVLTWTPGYGAQSHTVYFSEDVNNVNNATGGIAQKPNTYVPGRLDSRKTYYWRIDEFDGSRTHRGNIWSFTVRQWVIYKDIQVSAGKDDGYAIRDGLQNLEFDFMRVGSSTPSPSPYYMSGMVFRDVNLPQGVKIASARLRIRSHNEHLTDEVYAKIQAEDADNAASFDKSPQIAERPRTGASVDWDHIEPWSPDTWYESPDIASVIQKVISRNGWSAHHSLAILYLTREHKGGYRQFSPCDRGVDFAPVLEITYEP